MNSHFASAILITLLACALSSCTQQVVNTPDIQFPVTGVSFNGNVKPIFYSNCALSGCHDAYSQAGNVILESYPDLFHTSGLVIAGDTAHSILSQTLNGRFPHPADPYFDALNSNQRHGIIQWIFEGAHDN